MNKIPESNFQKQLIKSLKTKSTKIGIIGLGYVGLPLALNLSRKYKVIAFDNDRIRIKTLKNGVDFNNEFKKIDLKKKKNI